MYTTSTKVPQEIQNKQQVSKFDATSTHLITCVDRDLIEVSHTLIGAVNDLIFRQKQWLQEDLDDREATFQAEISWNQLKGLVKVPSNWVNWRLGKTVF